MGTNLGKHGTFVMGTKKQLMHTRGKSLFIFSLIHQSSQMPQTSFSIHRPEWGQISSLQLIDPSCNYCFWACSILCSCYWGYNCFPESYSLPTETARCVSYNSGRASVLPMPGGLHNERLWFSAFVCLFRCVQHLVYP